MIALIEPTSTDRIVELQQTISASRLGLWLTCRLKFHFRYVLKIQKPTTPALHTGTTIHAVLQAWNLARWRKEPFDPAMCKELFEARWSDQPSPIDWYGEEDQQRDQAWRMLETFFAETPIQADEKPEAVEVSVETDLSRHGLPTLIGVIDLVRAGGRIVDFKTSGKTPDAGLVAHQHEIQLSCYSVLYRDATGRREAGIELHHLVKTKTPKLVVTPLASMTPNQQTRLFRLIESYVRGLEREDFVPSPGFHCAGCEFFRHCRSWKGG
jgi:hypothetical protein